MRKLLFLALLIGAPLLSQAQDTSPAAAPAPAGTGTPAAAATTATTTPAAPTPVFTSETAHYRVTSETSQAQADDVSKRMEAALSLYNGVFHFDLSRLAAKFRVTVFKDLDSFNAYLDKLLSQKRNDFVFVAWSDPSRSELLCFPKDDKAFTASLLHQGCIQFIKGFIDNPPVWLREGVATYLDAASWDPTAGTFTARPNLAWLDGLKAIVRGDSISKLLALPDLLTISRDKAQTRMDVFAPQSWGMVQFLLNTPDHSYNRVFWDSLASLSPAATLDDNSQQVRARAFSWFTDDKLQQDFQAYVLSLKTATDLVKDGIDQYTKGDMAASEQSMTKSLDLEPSASTPWYYLGLIAYARKDYTKAQDDYMKAFQLGANAGVVNYALGVNSFAAGNNADATKYLTFAKQADATAYGDKVDTLLKRMQATK
jgi:tetratricopeptide (TPR) repeat protein